MSIGLTFLIYFVFAGDLSLEISRARSLLLEDMVAHSFERNVMSLSDIISYDALERETVVKDISSSMPSLLHLVSIEILLFSVEYDSQAQENILERSSSP